ncbi:MAG: adenylosuccinate synthase [Tenericutes bacterium GWC2_34_14]|nr:MAG: adenylosuccinate synthase [Tenericutes bacterium GWA2_35_7]OHE29327.1 MAG: adenylosuccinate synthase [Tenericutes bacterium GWC2_34_14]OHE34424.1 MAG: adenylosuccinate synthase [Tenericutes bacterium GWE2_34_108]OHE35780.1 MAG: adenylosuccinate synthase [Tenericutes bacterium GWF1_35_14]OHE39133.1 MAG: adenylosuccinate synthase [Tenericutes bacterium GWF2_35_184]OHE42381.1 MAG: adenylosuccinate synthase [Tenericutes bacterium RIFOXYA12_FULL_35_10]OHE42800.1 MAG: adenylosuccinate synth
MKRIVVVGTQWGDEGKGKITDFLAQHADVVVRYQGGNNAGHTVVFDGQKHSLHLLPSGILNPKIENVMANGMVINPKAFVEESSKIETPFKLSISDRAHIVLPYHPELDKAYEKRKGDEKIGTTHKGIGPAYTDKAARIGIRVSTFIHKERFYHELKALVEQKNFELNAYDHTLVDVDHIYQEYLPYAEKMRPYVKDTSLYLNQLIEEDKKILFEGAQGVLLCLDHGTYPYVTSSSPTASSVPLNTGIAPWLVEGAVGVTKAYTTRVGSGPMPSEIEGELAHQIREIGREYGTTTGRPRRIGWLDTVILRHTKRVSGLSYLAVTLLDVLTGIDELKIATSYTLDGIEIDQIPADIEDFMRAQPNYITMPGWKENITQVKSFDKLPLNAKNYLNKISTLVGVPIGMFSVGPDRNQTIMVQSFFE